MIEIFNAISNIAKNLEEHVFVNCQNFIKPGLRDEQIHQDVYQYCSQVIEDEFKYSKSVKAVVGKDRKGLDTNRQRTFRKKINENGKFLISYVAIDNVDLLDVNFSLGTIFGVYLNTFEGNSLKAAVYITYGPTFQLIFASKDEGVKFFSFEHGEFVQKESLELKDKGNINSCAGDMQTWSKEHKELVDGFFNEGYRLRMSDSLCLDTHQILFKRGGIYSSPATQKDPQGKLEVIFEAFPIAFIIEAARGSAIDGHQRILDIKSPTIHQKTPMYFGSKKEVARVFSKLKASE
jgi:fructose-1,6-bisphosphatase I